MSGSPPPQWKWNGRSFAFATARARRIRKSRTGFACSLVSSQSSLRQRANAAAASDELGIADVQTGPVGDDRLVRDAVRVGGRVGRLALHTRDEVVERPVRCWRIHGSRRHTRWTVTPIVAANSSGGDRRLREPLVGEDRDHARPRRGAPSCSATASAWSAASLAAVTASRVGLAVRGAPRASGGARARTRSSP